ncbi:homoserine kinase [Salinisphaera sp. USBA-960]|uniref:homoserine kinase n=1 Tax=Salinisphaera orenii TaxID=856731 RepID=UPI000DBE38CC|nr:homoserine kinase [Salifodinibacter halophilus]NNC25487.1 homoserine kinase [Salifodinibacter halophilus]
MAVYTRLAAADIRAVLDAYSVGELTDFRGIGEGVTNSTYFVDTTLGAWVLTVFEDLEHRSLPFFMQLMDHLAGHGLPVIHPVARDDGGFLSEICNRPCALAYRLPGASVVEPGPAHCASLARVVAEMHRAASGSGLSQANPRDLAWIADNRPQLASVLTADQRALVDAELADQRAALAAYDGLPRTLIHADLFRDNVLFEGTRVTGVIDFFYACDEHTLFDLAVICCDWAFDADNQFHADCWAAFIAAYQQRCTLGQPEIDAWPRMLGAAALRFWVSRLIDYHFPRSAAAPNVHDPAPFERLLRQLRADPPALMPRQSS